MLVLGEAQVDTTVARVEPAAGNGLAASEEVDSFSTVSLGVTEQ